MCGNRIGLLGGSFNPIHLGHIHAVELFMEALTLDMIIVIPSSYPFYKRTLLTDYRDRLAMCFLAFEAMENVIVSDVEKERPEGMPTCEVVAHMRGLYPRADLFLLVGDDVMVKMPQWKGIDMVIKEVHIGVLCRSSNLLEDVELRRLGAAIDLVRKDTLPCSSSMVRSAVTEGKAIGNMVPDLVGEYILTHNLYKTTRS